MKQNKKRATSYKKMQTDGWVRNTWIESTHIPTELRTELNGEMSREENYGIYHKNHSHLKHTKNGTNEKKGNCSGLVKYISIAQYQRFWIDFDIFPYSIVATFLLTL